MDRINLLTSLVEPYYKSYQDPSHDWSHILRVLSMAKELAKKEKASVEIVSAAILCHDLINLPKDHPERKQASTLSAKEALTLLEKCHYYEKEISEIQLCIVQHSFSKGLKPSTLESAIVQDADRLDALGAIGILRCASVNTQMKTKFYNEQDPMAKYRDLNDKEFMLDHYFEKLFKLPELMNTKTGKTEAQNRLNFMKMFIAQLESEIKLP